MRFSPQSNSFTQFLPSSFFTGVENRVTNIFNTKNGDIWLATISGLVQLVDQGERAILYQSDDTNVNSLAVNELLSLMIDKSGLLWIGTRGGGIDKLNLKRKAFEHYKVNVNSEIGLSSEIVRSICSDSEGNLFIGYQDVGFDVINREAKTKRNIMHDPAVAGSLTMNNITTIKQLKDNLLWVGTWGGGINIQKRTGSYNFEHLTTATPSSNGVPLLDDRIQMMLEDRYGKVWIGTENGLELYDLTGNAHRHFLHDPNNSNTVAAYGVQYNGIVEDAYGNIWVGTWGGLSRLTPEDPGKNTFVSTYNIQRYHFDPEDPLHSISDNRIISLHYDREKERDVIYAGTYGGGLNKITFSDNEPAKIVVESYTTKDGLPNNVIYTILSDKHGTLWLSANDGLSNFNPSEKTFKNYDVNDGLQSNQFFWGSSYKSQEGELFFGGINGFNAFFPDEINDDQYEPPVVLTDFRVFNRSVKPGEVVRKKVVLHQNINETVSLKLTHKENVFSFEFAALHYAFPDDNKYAYMMEGFDEGWIYVDGDQRLASYTNLDADTYTFKVKGANYDGIWNDTPKTIEVVITPPFHKTIWFYAVIVVGISGIIYAFIKWREKQLKEDKDLLQRAIDGKTQELEAQKQEILRRNEAEKVQNWTTAGLAEFSGIINKHKDSLQNLSEALLGRLIKFLNAHQGSITMLNEDDPQDKYLQLITTYAYDQAKLTQKRFETDEGLIGACYTEGEANYIQNLPDEYTKVGSGLGESHPRHLLLVPLKQDEIALGVIEVISFNGFQDHEVGFVEQLAEMVTSTLYTLQVSNRTKELLEQSQSQSEELKAQEEELRQNMEEMEATQEDFTRREQELHEKIDSLTKERNDLKVKLSEKVK